MKAKDFYILNDLDVEVGMMCTNENDIEEPTGMYGPLCWHGHDKNPGGLKKMMRHGIRKEFNCKPLPRGPCTEEKEKMPSRTGI